MSTARLWAGVSSRLRQKMISRIAHLLSYLTAGLSALLLLRPRGGFLAAALWFPKTAAGAWAPVLALGGGLAALLSGLGALVGTRRDTQDRGAFTTVESRAAAGNPGRVDPDPPVARPGPQAAPACLAVGAGLFAATVAARHTRRVTAPHTGFDQAFGPDWPARIRPELQGRLLARRYSPLLPSLPKARCLLDLVYAHAPESGEPLRADLWLAPAHVPATGLGVVYLFGGAWHYMDKELWTGHLLRYLACQGHAVLNAGYRLASQAELPAMVADARQAVAWLKTHGPAYGVDPARIVLMGCSSGAHLALLAAYTADRGDEVEVDTSVRAVISDSGFADLRSSYAYFRERFGAYFKGNLLAERWFLAVMGWIFRRLRMLPPGGEMVVPHDMLPSLLGGSPDQVPERYAWGSPLSHVGPHCPPTLLIQGAHDYCGIGPDVRRLHRALCQAGVPAVYVEYPEAEHSFLVVAAGAFRWAPPIQAALYDIERFLALMV